MILLVEEVFVLAHPFTGAAIHVLRGLPLAHWAVTWGPARLGDQVTLAEENVRVGGTVSLALKSGVRLGV